MKIPFALLLVPTTAMAQGHDLQASIGMVVLFAIGAIVWGVGVALFKVVFRKKTQADGDNVK